MEGIEKGVYGGAVVLLLKTLQENKASLEQLDGAITVTKAPATVGAAVTNTVNWLKSAHSKRKLQELLPFFVFSGRSTSTLLTPVR